MHDNVVISGKPSATPPFGIIVPERRVELVRGGTSFLNVRPMAKNIASKEMRVELDDPPQGVSAEIVTDNSNRFAVKLTVDAEEAEPGLRGNLLLRVVRETTPAATEENPNPPPRRTDYGLLPAIPFGISKHKSSR